MPVTLFSKNYKVNSVSKENTAKSIIFAPGDFTINTTRTGETCIGNGKINVTVSNAIIGATYSIEVYKSTDLSTPVKVTSLVATTNPFSYEFQGMNTGNYTVRVTESTGGINTTKDYTGAFVPDLKQVLTYTISQEKRCDGNYNIIITTKTGSAKTYTLKSENGATTIIPEQTSNVLQNVTEGTYRVDVKDVCDQYVNQNYTVVSELPYDLRLYYSSVVRKSCTQQTAVEYFDGNGGKIKFPLNYTIAFSNGSPSISGTLTSSSQLYYDFNTPTSGSVTAKITVTDGCGKFYPFSHELKALEKSAFVSKRSASCGEYASISATNFVDPVKFTFTNYPAGFLPNSYNSSFSNATYSATFNNLGYSAVDLGSPSNSLPAGDYTIIIEDNCGFTYPLNFNIADPQNNLIMASQSPGCEIGYGTGVLMATSDGYTKSVDLSSATIISAPAGFTGSTSIPINNGYANLNNLPEGAYTIETKYICGGVEKTLTGTINLVGLKITKNEVTVTPSCGKFDIKIDYTATLGYANFFLQKYNDATGLWVNPDNGMSQNPGDLTNTTNAKILAERFNNNGALINTSFNAVNYTYTGKMRIVLVSGSCTYILKEFDTQPQINLNNYYVFGCGPKFAVALDATGVPNLTYEIFEKNGEPFVVSNGTNPVFTNLEAGTYNLRVTDGCGNTKIFTVFANGIKLPVMTANLCEGQNGTLALPKLNFMTVTWSYNGGALPAGVTPNAGNNYQLDFTPYTKATHTGTYTAKLNYNFATSCEPATISYTLTPTNDIAPNAGTGQTLTLNAADVTAPLNLFNYLTGTYDSNGTWTETTTNPSGLLLDNIWHGNLAGGGTYTFQYTVKGTCSGVATSTVTIILNKACYKSPVKDGNIYPTRHGITALGRAGTERDNWPMIRQSAHTVLEAKTKGFVLNRVAFDNTNSPIGIPQNNWVEGMAVYDTTNNCMKVYFGTTIGWKCAVSGGCANN